MPGIARSVEATLASAMNRACRNAILSAAESARVEHLARRYGPRLGAARFVAGESLEECVAVLRALNAKRLAANTTLLGELVASEVAAKGVVAEYEQVLDRLHRERLDANVALKLTHLGLLVRDGLADESLRRLADRARRLGNGIRIDMEHSGLVDATLGIYRRLREAGYENVGCALQAYLRRSERDLLDLLPLRPNVRLVKGAYLEPPSVAYPRKADVDAAFVQLLELALPRAGYTAVATHDERLIEHAIRYAERERIARDRFEFQMLYGVRPGLQLGLACRGYRVRVATPFGPEWFPYLMRRLAERPANVGFLLRTLVRS